MSIKVLGTMKMYSYETEKKKLFTESGQVMFLAIRDRVNSLLEQSGAVRMQEAIATTAGDSWEMLACVDRMVELGELHEITGKDVAGQHRVFTR
jgi:hypothetical protein